MKYKRYYKWTHAGKVKQEGEYQCDPDRNLFDAENSKPLGHFDLETGNLTWKGEKYLPFKGLPKKEFMDERFKMKPKKIPPHDPEKGPKPEVLPKPDEPEIELL